EMGVAETAVATLRQHGALADRGEIGKQRLVVLVEYLGADRDLQDHIGGGRARAVCAHAVAAGLGLEVLLVAVVDERVEAVDAFDDDVAAASAVAAVRP